MDELFDRGSFDAGRLLVARLRSEAAYEHFDFADLGITWLDNANPMVALLEDGHGISANDLLFAALVLLWSLVTEHANVKGCDVQDVISELGISLASFEPNPPC